MSPHRPIGIVRLLAPLLGRARRRGRRGLVPMIWRIRRPYPRMSFAPSAARPHSSSFHCAINLSLTWALPGSPVAARERTIERILGELSRAGPPSTGVPAVARRGLPGLIERCRQWQRREAPARDAHAAAVPPLRPSPVDATVAVRPARAAAAPVSDEPVFRPLPRGARSAMFTDSPSRAVPVTWRRTPAGAASRATGGAMARPSMLRAAESASHVPTRLMRRARAVQLWRDGEAAIRLSPPVHAPVRPAPAPARVDPAGARSHAMLVWRRATVSGGPEPGIAARPGPPISGPGRTALVWREPAARETSAAPMSEAGMFSPSGLHSEPVAHGRHPELPAKVQAPAPDVGRLVDEVVRRLERIGRDERLRRGL